MRSRFEALKNISTILPCAKVMPPSLYLFEAGASILARAGQDHADSRIALIMRQAFEKPVDGIMAGRSLRWGQ